MSAVKLDSLAYSERFKSEFQALEPDVRQACIDALDLLLKNPQAKSLRLHPLSGFAKPQIWKIDVYTNHSWQVTFELIGVTAHLKRIATHKKIDRSPRG